jgi:membrane-bound serine protease (ClpP class)
VFFVVAVVLFLVLPAGWNVIGGVAALTVFGVEVAYWHRTVRRQRVAVGAETMIGATALAIAECRPLGQVRLNGEIWEARCDEGADPGDAVVVTDRAGLTLIVSRADATPPPKTVV